MESAGNALRREMREEFNAPVTVGRLLWLVENFFPFEGRRAAHTTLVSGSGASGPAQSAGAPRPRGLTSSDRLLGSRAVAGGTACARLSAAATGPARIHVL